MPLGLLSCVFILLKICQGEAEVNQVIKKGSTISNSSCDFEVPQLCHPNYKDPFAVESFESLFFCQIGVVMQAGVGPTRPEQ